eukprot:TRINITY_DN24516_c0_g1_i1.p1 TRINITY_DN24516_c0_g1~~TRINITY_DN24516_c0_g1_i1.p1  ORF type:complete len:345 (+),score=53.21 TRINITY_DN24516_c0_g1_i1:56-1036(+)
MANGLEGALVAADGLLEWVAIPAALALRAAFAAARDACREKVIVHLSQVAVLRADSGLQPALALRCLACVAAGCAGQRPAAAVAAGLVQGGVSPSVRLAATKALASTAQGLGGTDMGAQAVACLTGALRDGNERVAAAAAKALAKLVCASVALAGADNSGKGKRFAKAALLQCLRRHRAGEARQAAITALGDVVAKGAEDVVRALAEAATTDADWRVRTAACRALPRLVDRGNSVAEEALVKCFTDEVALVRRSAQSAVVHVSHTPTQHFTRWEPHPTVHGAQILVCRAPSEPQVKKRAAEELTPPKVLQMRNIPGKLPRSKVARR